MRTCFLIVALWVGLSSSTRAAAQTDDVPRGEGGVQVELGIRPGFGLSYYDLDLPSIPAVEDGGSSGVMHFGAFVAVRERRTGLGASLAWDHAFQGLFDHYGTHLFELRLSESLPLFVGNEWGINLLLEAGGGYFRGGATGSCGINFGGACTPEPSVNVEGGAFTSAIGLDFGVTRAFHAGFEVDYRYLAGVDSRLVGEHQLLFLARIGFAFGV